MRFSRLMIIALVMVVLMLVGVVWAAPPNQANLFELFLSNLRSDVELLANNVFGVDERPEAWVGNTTLGSENYIGDLWVDNELLAIAIFGEVDRPADWFGATTSRPELLARNIRHDLELSADQIFGVTRPSEWRSAGPLFQCDRELQNLVRLLDERYDVRPRTVTATLNYCDTLRTEVEDDLIGQVLSTSFADQAPELISGVRGDLERLADELLGLNTRPLNWRGNRDEGTASFASDIYIDLEALADDRLGGGTRPQDWVMQPPSSPSLAYRTLRYNLELLADLSLGAGRRPTGWQGVDPLARCSPTLQSLVAVVEQSFADIPIENANSADPTVFCIEVAQMTNQFAENPPPIVGSGEVVDSDTRYRARSRFAFSYLDVAALQYMGVMPYDTEFRAWYRNFNQSNMMFVSGQNFALFIDRRFTTMSEDVFRTLPTLEGRKPLTFCDAAWCNGPGPTPTPTGSGPLDLVLFITTPQPTRSIDQIQGEGKRLVTWNSVRVRYLLYRPEIRTVQVTLEVCQDPSQVACEPATNVFDNSTGTNKPILGEFNGLNVYEFTYGYINTVIIEGATLFSRDVWISDPPLATATPGF
jgi:hypothetical protein